MATESSRETTEGLPERVVTDLLSSDRRKHVLACLDEEGGCLPVADLASAVAARERDVDVDAVDRETRRDVREDIYERHLPKLTATGVVAFDSMRGTVTLEARDLAEAARR